MNVLPKLIAFDLDGTLLTSQKHITPRSIAAIRELSIRGVQIILCTGRPPRSTRSFMNQLNITHSIVYNGAALYDYPNDKISELRTLSPASAQLAFKRIRKAFPDVQAGLETTEGWFLDPKFYDYRLQLRSSPDQFQPDEVGSIERLLEGKTVIKLLFRHPEKSAQDLSQALSAQSLYQTWSASSILEVMHPQVNKRNALLRLTAGLGVKPEEIAAFGDQHNDREMLLWVGTSVTPANASPLISSIADIHTASNDKDGVSIVLEQWLSLT